MNASPMHQKDNLTFYDLYEEVSHISSTEPTKGKTTLHSSRGESLN